MIDIEVKTRQLLARENIWQVAYPALADLIRGSILADLGDEILTTEQLADRLIHSKDAPEKPRLFQALQALAAHALADCATRRPPVPGTRWGKTVVVRAWVWHAPRADYVWRAKTEEAPGPAPISPASAWVDIETFRALKARVDNLETLLLKFALGSEEAV